MGTIDVIVADVQMPLGSGLGLIERLAEARWKIPCILMTAFADDEVRRRAQSTGALLLEKPLSLDELREAVGLLARG
jgi:FixJ family two-component response regulator